jgi:hypothetical protein
MKTKLALNSVYHPQTVDVPLPLEVHPSVSPLAAELLMKTCDAIAREPKEYDQSLPISRGCGSPCCIIGHMGNLIGFRGSLDTHNCEKIGLTVAQYKAIWSAYSWPAQFYQRGGNELRWPDIPALTAIARIEHFLRTGE